MKHKKSSPTQDFCRKLQSRQDERNSYQPAHEGPVTLTHIDFEFTNIMGTTRALPNHDFSFGLLWHQRHTPLVFSHANLRKSG